jgi:hypothetical protein
VVRAPQRSGCGVRLVHTESPALLGAAAGTLTLSPTLVPLLVLGSAVGLWVAREVGGGEEEGAQGFCMQCTIGMTSFGAPPFSER